MKKKLDWGSHLLTISYEPLDGNVVAHDVLAELRGWVKLLWENDCDKTGVERELNVFGSPAVRYNCLALMIITNQEEVNTDLLHVLKLIESGGRGPLDGFVFCNAKVEERF